MPASRCLMCAHDLDDHDRHVRFTLPQPVLDGFGTELPPDSWLSHDTPGASVMMQVPSMGAFVRALLPIRMTGGHTLTYGLWLAVDPGELHRIFGVWWEPEYVDLRFTGWLANPVPPWGMLTTLVDAVVRDPEHTPYCDQSPDPVLGRVLTEEWRHAEVLGALGPG